MDSAANSVKTAFGYACLYLLCFVVAVLTVIRLLEVFARHK
jgi:TRAP-type C4-dicarboxylate transport system permease small subunit